MRGKHTPAPWKLEGNWEIDSNPIGGWISTEHPVPLFELTPMTGNPAGIIANARLIAAAPETAAERDRLKAVNADLLAALKDIADQGYVDEPGTIFQRKARKAIAKAIGAA
jgi:hypothetical protein